ncbi:aldehyde dehydrogenase [Liquorilactobacillus oeni]|uniref:3-sulfolactaldehyde dehydrogenase n=1 Tax=Liquorilactobacillus oeni DSM 19972 TaxID=1423777 RepID=A0A0R1MIB3_9LACO|nr:aldehyde dehydrogenase [Liquorilactobacillus oeni]KRL04139.1 hypothetical protein FD46_GL001256 [Liquorilactobacillus oeni DSM 19972]
MDVQNRQFINGSFVSSDSSETDVVYNPANNKKIGTIARGNEEDVYEAVAGAAKAQKKWAQVNRIKRAELVLQLANLISQNKNELAKIYQDEQGKVWAAALGEIEKSIGYIKYMASLAQSDIGEVLQNEVENETIMLVKKPIGVTAGIIPWNAPILILMRKLIPALITGCSVIVKPSSETPFGTLKIAELLQQTDIPAGLVQVVTGSGAQVGGLLAKNKNVDLISITGSTSAGKAVMKAAAANVKKVNLELGGNAPAIVTSNADLDKAVKYIVTARINNSGQVCTCPERVYVQENVSEEFIQKLVKAMKKIVAGDPKSAKTDMGPIINQKQLKAIDEKVKKASSEGAEVLTGGHIIDRPGNYYEPTVVTGVSEGSSIMHDEIFGPVLPVATFKTLTEVVNKANNSPYGLSSYAFTENLKEAMELSNRLKFGEVYVNCEAEEAITGFHAGWRQSGLGGADGKHGFDEYLNTTVAYLRYE